MDQDKALSILGMLADGINPQGGERFSPDSPYQHPDVVRALYTAVECLKSKAPKAGPVNAGKPWSREEDALLLAAFSAGHSIEALATKHGRSRTGIEARLAKYGKVSLSSPLPSSRFEARQPFTSYNPNLSQ